MTLPTGPATTTTRRLAAKLPVALRILLALAWMVAAPNPLNGNLMWGDVVRYGEIHAEGGRAYRDRAVEYPPVTLAAIELVTAGRATRDATTARVVIGVNLACDLAAAAALGWGFGPRARRTYLLVGLPIVLTGLPYLRLDLLSVALACGGLALVRRRRPTAGGLVLVVGAFAKLWPAVLLPVLAVERRWRALATSLAVGTAGLVTWIAYGGVEGPRQVLTLRGAHGWQIESVPGSVVRLVTGARPFNEAGAWRIGDGPAAARWVVAAVGLVVVAAAWARAGRRAAATDVAPVVAVAALLATSALLSPQFVVWLLPAVALLPEEPSGETTRRLALAVSVLTALVISMEIPIRDGAAGPVAVLLLRNVLLVAVAASAWAAGRRAPESSQCSNDRLPAPSRTRLAPTSSRTPTAA